MTVIWNKSGAKIFYWNNAKNNKVNAFSLIYVNLLKVNAFSFIYVNLLKVNAFSFIYVNLLNVNALSPRKPADFLLTLDILRRLSSIFVFVLFAMQYKVRLGRTKRYHLF